MAWPDSDTVATTDPAYYPDAADPREAELRAAFTRYYQLRLIAPFGENAEQVAELTAQAKELAIQWGGQGPPAQRQLWAQLGAATAEWEAHPETTRAAFASLARSREAGDVPVDEQLWRTLRQAAQITGSIEPDIAGSTQDGARSRPTGSALGREEAPDLLTRALGGRGPEIVDMAEVGAILSGRDAEESQDPNTGDGAAQRDAALVRVTDLTAEHARVSTRFAGVHNHDQDLIERLEDLLDQVHDARIDAASLGASPRDIYDAYLVGRDGTDTAAPSAAASEGGPDPGAEADAAIAAATTTTGTDGEWGPDQDPVAQYDATAGQDLDVAM